MNPMKPMMTKAILLTWLGAFCGFAVASDHWPQFRGPNAAGISTNADLPHKWSTTENVAWTTDLPGRSWSSPVVWGERIFLTSVVNTGESEAPKKGLYFGGERPEPSKAEHLWPDDMCMATPALAGDRLLIRTAARLYCLWQARQAGSP